MNKHNFLRKITQYGILALLTVLLLLSVFFPSVTTLNPESYCPFGGLQALSSYFVSESLACSMTATQIGFGVLLVICVILFSKLFCSYICPLGTISELMSKLGKKLKIQNAFPIIVDKILRIIKYILLFITFYFTITSSELFCKKYDPFFAVFSGFNNDIVLWASITSMVLLIVGSMMVRMFWCKYICPLGALQNFFKMGGMAIFTLSIYFILYILGVKIPFVVLLAVICVAGYVLEVLNLKLCLTPFMKVTKKDDLCTKCKKCDKQCPYGIEVSDMSKAVKDIDCNLCGDCISSCSKEKSLGIFGKHKLKWLPIVLLVALISLGFYLANTWEIPTISETWGTKEQMAQTKVFSQSGLRSVKCFSSSKSFAAKMKRIQGVYGVETFVGTHTVKVFYNPAIISENELQKKIFEPSKAKLYQKLPKDIQQVKVVTLGVENLHGKMDVVYLRFLFLKADSIGFLGIQTEFDCPAKLRVYMRMEKAVNNEELKKIVESEKVEIKQHGKISEKEIDFKVVKINSLLDTITRETFIQAMFNKFEDEFSRKIKIEDNDKAIYRFSFPNADKPLIMKSLPYLGSHLSSYKNLISANTEMINEHVYFNIVFNKTKINSDSIWDYLQKPEWKITYSDSIVKMEAPKFRFNQTGVVIDFLTGKEIEAAKKSLVKSTNKKGEKAGKKSNIPEDKSSLMKKKVQEARAKKGGAPLTKDELIKIRKEVMGK